MHVIEWSYAQSGKTENYSKLIAAQMQHHYAVAINRRLSAERRKLKNWAWDNDIPYDRLSKVMRGAVVMRLSDIAIAELVLGDIVSPDVYRAITATIRLTREQLAEANPPHG